MHKFMIVIFMFGIENWCSLIVRGMLYFEFSKFFNFRIL
jgi:hypothetical protein